MLVLTEIRLVGGALASLLRRPLPEAPQGAFSTTRASTYGLLIAVLAGVSLIEMSVVHLVLAKVLRAHALPHVVLASLHVYGILWLIGDRRLMAASWHQLDEAGLRLHLGLRFQARIPYEKIARVLPLRDDEELRSVQPRRGRNPRATPFEAPNVHLCFDANVPFTTYFGMQRQMGHLDVYVDEPEALIAALAPKIAAAG